MEEKVPGGTGELSQDDGLSEEIRTNLRHDRNLLVNHLSKLYEYLDNLDDEDVNPRLKFTESIALLVDQLSKNNAQLVELAKIKAKVQMSRPSDSKLSGDDIDDVYSDIDSNSPISGAKVHADA